MLGYQQIREMFIENVKAEDLAEVFHHYHQTLNENEERDTVMSEESWDKLPGRERDRLIAAARLTILELNSDTTRRKYFAKPGEAEWGC